MRPDSRIVSELRSMFLNGAAPSRLIRHIASRYEGDPDWSDYVGPYFAEAFSVTTIALDRYPHPVDLDRIDLSDLDGELLRDMVGRLAGWRDKSDVEPGAAWCDGLAVSPDDATMIDSLQPESHPALKNAWSSLSPEVQGCLRRSMVNAQGYYERFQVLTRLVERLQKQVLELERNREEVEA